MCRGMLGLSSAGLSARQLADSLARTSEEYEAWLRHRPQPTRLQKLLCHHQPDQELDNYVITAFQGPRLELQKFLKQQRKLRAGQSSALDATIVDKLTMLYTVTVGKEDLRRFRKALGMLMSSIEEQRHSPAVRCKLETIAE